MDKKNNILIVAPHADDEILGCGGIISKYANNGDNVYIVIVTNANIGAPDLFTADDIYKVRSEALEAHKLLQVTKTFFLEFPAPRLETHPSFEISNALAKIIYENKIDTMFIPHKGDIHRDHTVVYYSCLVAARPINSCPVKKILSYETLSETEWSSPDAGDVFIPNVFIDITQFLSNKLKAMSCFSSQIKEPPHPRSLNIIEHLARLRGSTIGCTCAEAFMLVRSIIQ
jgi:LmbE family N-acetylglucosaminyl deacetylase